MGKENFSEFLLKQLIEYYQQYDATKVAFEKTIDTAILDLVKLVVEECKKRNKLENDIKDILRPHFNEEEMPEDVVEALKQFIGSTKFITIAYPATGHVDVETMAKYVNAMIGKNNGKENK